MRWNGRRNMCRMDSGMCDRIGDGMCDGMRYGMCCGT